MAPKKTDNVKKRFARASVLFLSVG